MTVSWPHPATWAWSRGACDGHRRDCAAEASALPDVNIIDLVTVQPKRRLEAGGGGKRGARRPSFRPLCATRQANMPEQTVAAPVVPRDSVLNNDNLFYNSPC